LTIIIVIVKPSSVFRRRFHRQRHLFRISSAKEIMFSSALVCLFVFLAKLCKSYSTDFQKIRWKGGTWAMEEKIGFW